MKKLLDEQDELLLLGLLDKYSLPETLKFIAAEYKHIADQTDKGDMFRVVSSLIGETAAKLDETYHECYEHTVVFHNYNSLEELQKDHSDSKEWEYGQVFKQDGKSYVHIYFGKNVWGAINLEDPEDFYLDYEKRTGNFGWVYIEADSWYFQRILACNKCFVRSSSNSSMWLN